MPKQDSLIASRRRGRTRREPSLPLTHRIGLSVGSGEGVSGLADFPSFRTGRSRLGASPLGTIAGLDPALELCPDPRLAPVLGSYARGCDLPDDSKIRTDFVAVLAVIDTTIRKRARRVVQYLLYTISPRSMRRTSFHVPLRHTWNTAVPHAACLCPAAHQRGLTSAHMLPSTRAQIVRSGRRVKSTPALRPSRDAAADSGSSPLHTTWLFARSTSPPTSPRITSA